jgi:Mor family transcriptional regulator
MKKNSKTSILSILIIIITFITIRQSMLLHKGFKNIKIPNKESRQLGNMSIYEWLTVKKISGKYNISEQEIFKILEITPHSGDENMSIVELTKKYNKTPEEMKKNLRKVIKNPKDSEGKKHE